MSNNRNRRRTSNQGNNGAVLHLTTPATDAPDPYAARELLFTIDGKEYTIPRRVPTGAALEYLERCTVNLDDADIWALRYALGDNGYVALKNFRALTGDNLGQIVAAVRSKFSGALTDPKGSTG